MRLKVIFTKKLNYENNINKLQTYHKREKDTCVARGTFSRGRYRRRGIGGRGAR